MMSCETPIVRTLSSWIEPCLLHLTGVDHQKKVTWLSYPMPFPEDDW